MKRSMSQKHYGRALGSSARLLLFALMVLLAAACGREAQPRAAQSAVPPSASQPTSPPMATPAPAASQPAARAAEDGTSAGDPRAQGDPAAPITVIEYGDYQ